MHWNITHKIAVILLVPTIGAMLFIMAFVQFLHHATASPEFINVAGKQRLIASQFKIWINPASTEQPQVLDYQVLSNRIDEFEHGLELIGDTIALYQSNDSEQTLVNALKHVERIWDRLKPQLNNVIQQQGLGNSQNLFSVKEMDDSIYKLIEASDKVVAICVQKQRQDGEKMLSIALWGAVINFFLLLLGVWIVKQYKQQQTLTREKLKLQAKVIDEIHDAVIRADLDGIINSWNFGAERMSGYSATESLGRHISVLFPAEERDTLDSQVIMPLKKQGALEMEVQMQKKSGEKYFTLLSLSLLHKDSVPIGMIGYAVDITARKQAEQELRKSEQRIRNIVESTSDWVWELDSDTRYTYVSPQMQNMLGYNESELIGKTPFDLMLPDEAQRVRKIFKPLAENHQSIDLVENTNRHKNGQLVVLESSGLPFFDEKGNWQGYRGVHRDITARKQTDQALKKLAEDVSSKTGRAFFSSLVTSLVQTLDVDYAFVAQIEKGVSNTIVLCHDGKLLDNISYSLFGTPCAVAMEENYCCYADGVQSLFPEDRMLVDVGAKAYVGVKVADTSENTIGLVSVLSKSVLYNSDTILSILKLYGLRIAAEFERCQNEARLQKLAHYDTLTNIPNRNLFVDRLENALARTEWNNRQVGVMFIDLDRFKHINDTLGHSVGDNVLQLVAERLQQCLRDGDTVARLGGDEFVVLLNEVAKEQDVARIAEKIINILAVPYEDSGHDLYVTASIGVSIGPRDGRGADDLMKHADSAMYSAKSKGKNTFYIYNDELGQLIKKRFRLEKELRCALSNDEFCIFYQPQICSITGKIQGLEALLRWQHPDQGLILPGEFVPVLEETGLMKYIGKLVLSKVCKQMKEWGKLGVMPRVAINISPSEFNFSNLVENIHSVVKDYEIDPQFIEVEITENVLLHDSSINTLQALKALGFGVSIDDFGTGYSSLNYLKKFSFDSIKLDCLFIKEITHNTKDAAIAEAVIMMSHKLGISVTAEGVETEEQLRFITRMGCDRYQGFYFSKALPVAEINKLLKMEYDGDNVIHFLNRTLS